MSDYDNLSVDPDLAAKVALLLHTGMWPSRRALYHDLIRRGLMDLASLVPVQALLPPTSSPPAPAPIPSADPPMVGPSAEAGASHRPRGRGGRPPRRANEVVKKDVGIPGPAAAGVASAGAHASIPPQPARTGGGISRAPAANAPAAAHGEDPAWTCPACGGTFPLEERWVHKPKCPGKGFAGSETRPPDLIPPQPPQPPGPKVDLEKLRRRVLDALRDAGRSANPRGYLVALVQRAVEEQGVPELPEAEASRIVQDLARRDPAVERVLGRVVA